MSIDYGLLQTLHRMHRQLTDIGERMNQGPRMLRIVAANDVEFSQAKDDAKIRFNELRKASNAKQMQLSEREAKIEDMKNKLNVCSSNKEFQLLKDRIAADLQANSVLQDEILEQLERLDVLSDESDQAIKNHEKSQSDLSNTRDRVGLEQKALESEKTRVAGELVDSEKLLPSDLQYEYRRLVAGKGEDAFGLTNTDTCGNCNQRLTPQTVTELMLKKPVFCKGCGCWMYVQ